MRILILLLLFTVILADSCGGNCPSGHCPTCYCGTSKRVLDIGTWCAKHNWNQACCKCIVSHESGGNANAMNYNGNKSTDVGLWQINSVVILLCRSTGVDVIVDTLLVTHNRTLTVLSRYIPIVAAGDPGAPIRPAGADLIHTHIYTIHIYRLN